MRGSLVAIAAALMLSAPALSQISDQHIMDMSRVMSRLVGLSPEGTELVARDALKRSRGEDFSAVTRVEIAIGEELAAAWPDRARLNALIERYAAENAKIDRSRKSREIEIALKLSSADRLKFGRFVEQGARRSLAKEQRNFPGLP